MFECSPEGPPDILAFTITLLMMVLFFYGVKKSVVFNHVLNVFNLVRKRRSACG